MLVGPGGVFALLVGLWGAWWASSTGAAHQPRTSWPVLLAFAAAILAFSAWSMLTEPVAWMVDAVSRRGENRSDAAHTVPVAFWASVRGLAAGWTILGVGAIASRFGPEEFERSPDRVEQVASGLAFASGGAAVAVAMVLAPQLLGSDPAGFVSSRHVLQLGSWVGVIGVWAALAASGVTLLRRRLRAT